MTSSALTGLVAGFLAPESGGSPNADDIWLLYWIALAMGIAIFLLVEGVLVYTLVKHRFRRKGREALQVRGNTPLEIGWTLGATAIVTVLAVITFAMLGGIMTPAGSGSSAATGQGKLYAATDLPGVEGGGRPLEIGVNGQQYMWRYDYPGVRGRLFTYHEMVVPTNTTVVLDITSQDVAHSWWIPKLGGKADALPGHNNQTWFRIERPGLFVGQCAELCGENHAAMGATVRAVSPDEYRAWTERQIAGIRASQEALIATRRSRGTDQ